VAHPETLEYASDVQSVDAIAKRLRISLTSSCNLACFFCHNEGQGPLTPQRSSSLSVADYVEIVKAAVDNGVTQIKLTGGEPLIYRDGALSIVDLVTGIANLKSRHDFELSMTTNGVLLSKFASKLSAAGLDRVTISIHALGAANHAAFIAKAPSSRFFSPATALEAASQSGLGPVKVNTVLFGDSEVGSVGELQSINKLVMEHNVTELRLYTIIDPERNGVSPQWHRQWSDGLAEDVGSILFSETDALGFAQKVRSFLRADSSALQRRSLRVRSNIDYVIDAMEPERFGALGITDEGPYAIRIAADGTMRSYLNHEGALATSVLEVAGGVKSLSRLRLLFEEAQESFQLRHAE